MPSDNLIRNKSYCFALQIIKLWKELRAKKYFEISSQLIRSGTAVGANVEEALGCFTKRDFAYKMSVAYKEARETSYWIRLLKDSDVISAEKALQLLNDSQQLERILLSIIKSTRRKYNL